MSDTAFNFNEVCKKLQSLINNAEDVVERDARVLYEQYLEWEKIAVERIPEKKLCEIFSDKIEKGTITLRNFLGIWGNLSVESVAKICLICRWLQPNVVFEIGTFTGMTTYQMALNTTNCRIYTLDLPSNTDTQNTLSEIDQKLTTHFDGRLGTKTGCYFHDTFEQHKIKQLWGDSATFDFSEFYEKVDLIFIDAAHDYENKKSDTENALKMLKRGGVIVWDNYRDPLNPYCTKFLGELNLNLSQLKGTNLVVYKDENSNSV